MSVYLFAILDTIKAGCLIASLVIGGLAFMYWIIYLHKGKKKFSAILLTTLSVIFFFGWAFIPYKKDLVQAYIVIKGKNIAENPNKVLEVIDSVYYHLNNKWRINR